MSDHDHASSPPRWKQQLATKSPRDGQRIGTCGHVRAGDDVFLFEGFVAHDETDVMWLAVCPACGAEAEYDLTRVKIVDYVTVGDAS